MVATDFQVDLRICEHLRIVNLHAVWFGSPYAEAAAFQGEYLRFMIQHLPSSVHELRISLLCGPYEVNSATIGLQCMPWPSIFAALPRDHPIRFVTLCLMWGPYGVRPLPWTKQMKNDVEKWSNHLPSMYSPSLFQHVNLSFHTEGTSLQFRLSIPANDEVAVYWESTLSDG